MGEIRAISLSGHETKAFEEFKTSGKKYILNGKNNNGYQYVIDRYKNSPTNSAILDSYFNFIYGKGLTANYRADQATQMAQVNKLLRKNEVRKIVGDYRLFHEASFEVILGKSGDAIAEINHLPINKIAPSEVNENGEIESYWYCYDWSNVRKYPPVEIPVFKQGTKEKRTIFVIKEYCLDSFYFARPSYYSGLNYAELEEQIGIYCINHIKNGLSAGYIINVNEGIVDEEVKDKFEANVIKKWCGPESTNRFMLSFNSSKENASTIEAIEVSDAHQQYQFLTEEARKQLLVAHKVVSGSIIGININTGFTSSAEEIETAFNETMLNVIKPIQDALTDGFEYVLGQNDISLQLFFDSLRTPKAVDTTSVKMSEEKKKSNLDTDVANGLIELGEDITDEWELVSEAVVCHDDDDKFHSFATTGTAKPNVKSENDSKDYKVRYKYNGPITPKSREFCRLMIEKGKIYRKEDIESMNSLVVNEGWGEYGTEPYSIWKFKGGGACRHNWLRQIYVAKGFKVDVNSPLAELININEARRDGFNKDLNDLEAFVVPNTLPNNGFLHK